MSNTDFKKDLHEAQHRLCITGGERKYHLHIFGDHLAAREEYKEYSGMDAIHYYIIQKHNWLPSQVRNLSSDDLLFLLGEEMQGWILPKDTIF